LPPGILDANTILVLGNAIYFLGAWTVAFDPTNTSTQPFYLSGSKFAGVPLMHQPGASENFALYFNYMQSYPLGEAPGSNDFQAIELPYGTNQLSMMVLLPSQVDGLSSLEQQLSPAFLANVEAQFQPQAMDVFLPRFRLGSTLDLKKTLGKMG